MKAREWAERDAGRKVLKERRAPRGRSRRGRCMRDAPDALRAQEALGRDGDGREVAVRVDRLHDAVVAVRAQRGHDHVRDDRRVDARGDLESARGRGAAKGGAAAARRGEGGAAAGAAGRGVRGRTGQLSMSQKIPSGATFASIVVGEASRGAREGCRPSSHSCALLGFGEGGASGEPPPRPSLARASPAATPRRRDGRGGSRCARGRGVKWGGRSTRARAAEPADCRAGGDETWELSDLTAPFFESSDDAALAALSPSAAAARRARRCRRSSCRGSSAISRRRRTAGAGRRRGSSPGTTSTGPAAWRKTTSSHVTGSRRARSWGTLDAQSGAGTWYADKGDYDAARKWWEKAAAQGSRLRHVQPRGALREGEGVERNSDYGWMVEVSCRGIRDSERRSGCGRDVAALPTGPAAWRTNEALVRQWLREGRGAGDGAQNFG